MNVFVNYGGANLQMTFVIISPNFLEGVNQNVSGTLVKMSIV